MDFEDVFTTVAVGFEAIGALAMIGGFVIALHSSSGAQSLLRNHHLFG
jgi:hypothetical protein